MKRLLVCWVCFLALVAATAVSADGQNATFAPETEIWGYAGTAGGEQQEVYWGEVVILQEEEDDDNDVTWVTFTTSPPSEEDAKNDDFWVSYAAVRAAPMRAPAIRTAPARVAPPLRAPNVRSMPTPAMRAPTVRMPIARSTPVLRAPNVGAVGFARPNATGLSPVSARPINYGNMGFRPGNGCVGPGCVQRTGAILPAPIRNVQRVPNFRPPQHFGHYYQQPQQIYRSTTQTLVNQNYNSSSFNLALGLGGFGLGGFGGGNYFRPYIPRMPYYGNYGNYGGYYGGGYYGGGYGGGGYCATCYSGGYYGGGYGGGYYPPSNRYYGGGYAGSNYGYGNYASYPSTYAGYSGYSSYTGATTGSGCCGGTTTGYVTPINPCCTTTYSATSTGTSAVTGGYSGSSYYSAESTSNSSNNVSTPSTFSPLPSIRTEPAPSTSPSVVPPSTTEPPLRKTEWDGMVVEKGQSGSSVTVSPASATNGPVSAFAPPAQNPNTPPPSLFKKLPRYE